VVDEGEVGYSIATSLRFFNGSAIEFNIEESLFFVITKVSFTFTLETVIL
jgi:hypothetical protein